jgi:hypothetical protein
MSTLKSSVSSVHGRRPLLTILITQERASGQTVGQRLGRGAGIATDTDIDLLDESEHLRVRVDLDDLRLGRPIVEIVLRQRAERAEAGAQSEHHVCLGDQLHRGLGPLVAERATPLGMARWEGIIVQIAVDHRAAEPFRQGDRVVDAATDDHTATGDHHRESRRREQIGRFVERPLTAGATIQAHRRRDLHIDVAVEPIAGNVELSRTDLRHRTVETAGREFGHAVLVVDMALILRELLEHRKLIGLLESTETHSHRARLRRHDHDRAVSPVRSGDRGYAVRDSGSVLADDHSMTAAGPCIPVGHVSGALLMNDGNEFDAGRREYVHRVHEGAAHDAEDRFDAVGDERLDECLTGGHAGHLQLLFVLSRIAVGGRAFETSYPGGEQGQELLERVVEIVGMRMAVAGL